jgi:glycosyltransferase involved in cell wall biosynthesis
MTVLTGLDLPVGSPGGSVELLHDLYLAPPDPPIDAAVFMLTGSGPSFETRSAGRLALLDVPGKQLDGAGFWAYVDDLARAIKRRFAADEYAIVHRHHLAFGATAALQRAFPGHPSLTLVHGTDLLFAADHPTQRTVLNEAVASTGAVVVPTAAMADRLVGICGVPPRRVSHIPWGVPDHLLAAPPRGNAVTDGTLRLAYAGRLTAEKGFENVLAAADLDHVRLSVAAPAAEYRALAARADLTGVDYLGWLRRPQLWSAFADQDVLVVPSTRLEAFGLVAVEAQACGLPVIYQPVPGLTEVLGDSAIAVELGAGPDPLADTLTWLRKDADALSDIRRAGYRNAARFPLSSTARQIRELSTQLQG